MEPAVRRAVAPGLKARNGRWGHGFRRGRGRGFRCRHRRQRRRKCVAGRRRRAQGSGKQILVLCCFLQRFVVGALPRVRVGVNGLAASEVDRSDDSEKGRNCAGRAGHGGRFRGRRAQSSTTDSVEFVTGSKSDARDLLVSLAFIQRRALGTPLVFVDESHVVEPEQPEDRGVEIVDMKPVGL